MNRERLQQMVTMLRGLPPEGIKFNLKRWYDDENSCGTTACAVGYACCSKVFTEQGLRIVNKVPTFERYESWGAVEQFFDLSMRQTNYLFYSPEYPNGDDTTAAEVADRIERLIGVEA